MQNISIIICTYNRKEELKVVLLELLKQFNDRHCKERSDEAISSSKLELIVVDNNSSDGTASLVNDLIGENKSGLTIRYVFEAEAGSSAARNRGVKEAQGELLAFLDDDIELARDWLEIVFKLAKSQCGIDAYGGRVVAKWAKPVPEWLNLEPPFELIQSCFPAHDYGNETKTYPFKVGARLVQNPISACFLCTKKVFDLYGGFRTDLGIKADKRGACEDSEFFWRIIAAGANVRYAPELIVYHPIPEKRMQPEFVLEWYRLLGATIYYLQKNNLVHLSPSAKVPSFMERLVKLVIFTSVYFLSYLFISPAKSFWLKAQIYKAKGAL